MSSSGIERLTEYAAQLLIRAYRLGEGNGEIAAILGGKISPTVPIKDFKAHRAYEELCDDCDRLIMAHKRQHITTLFSRHGETAKSSRMTEVPAVKCTCGRIMTLSEINNSGQRCPRCRKIIRENDYITAGR